MAAAVMPAAICGAGQGLEIELERRAEEMAQKVLPASLPEAVRAAKLPAVRQGILKRLRAQQAAARGSGIGYAATEMESLARQVRGNDQYDPFAQAHGHHQYDPFAQTTAIAGDSASSSTAAPAPVAAVVDWLEAAAQRAPPPRRPRVAAVDLPPPQDGVEACGDDPWFADPQVRRALCDAVEAAHAEQKILVGNPADEIARICPKDGRCLGAGAVLRLGGAHLGGYGEADIAYAYRQLSRALHPDKNRESEDAPAAFRRLREAADELRQGLEDARAVLETFGAALAHPVREDALVRPQEALFADAMRLVCSVLALSTEGQVGAEAQARAEEFLQTPEGSWAAGGSAQGVCAAWFQAHALLSTIGHAAVRSAYDCAPKRYRAHFLCALTRLAILESLRGDGQVRAAWGQVWGLFPELNLWQMLRDLLSAKCRQHGLNPQRSSTSGARRRGRSRSRSGGRRDGEEDIPLSQWATRWRKVIRAVLPPGGACSRGAAPWSDPEVRKLCAALWRDFADELKGLDARRALELFQAERRGEASAATPATREGSAPAEWAFVPAADVLLLVGEGLVGVTVEGVFVEKDSPQQLPFACAIFQSLV